VNTTLHIDLETLARSAEGALSDAEARAVRDHLAGCRNCLAAYADAIRYRAAWLADDRAFAAGAGDLAGTGQAGISPVSRRPMTSRVLVTIAASIAAIVIAWSIWPRMRAPALGFDLGPATRTALRGSSATGMILPGTEQLAESARIERRSAAHSSSPEFDRELAAAIARYEYGARDAVTGGRVVAGLLADGEIGGADDYAREVLLAHPRSVPVLVFSAEARARMNDLPEAERLLRRAAAVAPTDPLVALDLGVVLCRLDRPQEAQALLRRVSQSSVASIARQARRTLEHCVGQGAGTPPAPAGERSE